MKVNTDATTKTGPSEEIRELLTRARQVIMNSTQESEKLLDMASEIIGEIDEILS